MQKKQSTIRQQRQQRKARVRAKIYGTPDRPRLVVNRSLKNISAQIIDDTNQTTLVSVHQRELKLNMKKVEAATALGKVIAEKAQNKGIKTVVFDRRYYKYHGRIKAFADAAREAGLTI